MTKTSWPFLFRGNFERDLKFRVNLRHLWTNILGDLEKEMMMEARDPQTYAIIGAALEVHNQLGNGFLEAVYQEALAIEFELRGIPFQKEVPLAVRYKGRELSCKYKADFVCYGNIIVECKALSEIAGTHRSQVLNYLKATEVQRGLLLNFGMASLRHERLVWGFDMDPE